MKTERAESVTHEETSPSIEPAREENEVLDPAMERVLRHVDLVSTDESAVDDPGPTVREAPPGGAYPRLRIARLSRIENGKVFLKLRGHIEDVEADVDESVEIRLLMRSNEAGQAVLIEEEPGLLPVIVGTVQTRIPDTLQLSARKVVIEGEEDVLVRSGTGAMRVRQDGDVEIVGSRLTMMSRGLFRLVGRMLRLN